MNEDAASLSRLHDIVVPSAVPWWPPAPGWLWLFAALAIVGLALLVRGVLSWKRNRYRREALAALQKAGGETGAIAEILKRTALAAFPRAEVAAFTGAPWFAFLDRTGRMNFFAEQSWLERSLYDPSGSAITKEQRENLMSAARQWIRHHRTTGEAS